MLLETIKLDATAVDTRIKAVSALISRKQHQAVALDGQTLKEVEASRHDAGLILPGLHSTPDSNVK